MSFDTSWETTIYGQGRHLNRYPFDVAVSFVFRHFDREKPREETRILEVGCGAANNLWFAAREGFRVYGQDASASAVAYARQRFAAEGLQADLQVGEFTRLPYPDGFFDLVLDRASITCAPRLGALQAVEEVRRVLSPGGRFLHNSYSDLHPSGRQGTPGPDGVVLDIRGGTLAGLSGIRFYTEADMRELFAHGWNLESVQHLHLTDVADPAGDHTEWRVVARKAQEAS